MTFVYCVKFVRFPPFFFFLKNFKLLFVFTEVEYILQLYIYIFMENYCGQFTKTTRKTMFVWIKTEFRILYLLLYTIYRPELTVNFWKNKRPIYKINNNHLFIFQCIITKAYTAILYCTELNALFVIPNYMSLFIGFFESWYCNTHKIWCFDDFFASNIQHG